MIKETFDVLNSGFVASFLSALAGALFGAMAAHKIASKSKLKEELVKEIRVINASIGLTASIANAVLSLKRQHLSKLWQEYKSTYDEIHENLRLRKLGLIQGAEPVRAVADMVRLTAPDFPLEALMKMTFENMSTAGRPIVLMTAIAHTIKELEDTLNRRNILIEDFKKSNGPENPSFPKKFFAVANDEGGLDSEYRDALWGAVKYTDDLIFFSELMCGDLMEYGKKKVKEYKLGKFGGSDPKIHSIDFSEARAAKLMPNHEDYKNWLEGFKSKDEF